MKPQTRDLRFLLPPVLGATFLIAAAVLLIWLAYGHAQDSTRQRDEAQAAFRRIDAQLRQINSEEQELRDKAALYSRLQQRGIIGNESRLDWSEQLATLRQQWRLPVFSYGFAPQTLTDANSAGYSIARSGMHLHMHLLHEEDLLRILSPLRDEARALVQIRSCRLTRLATTDEHRFSQAQLEADCEMDWVTLRPFGGK